MRRVLVVLFAVLTLAAGRAEAVTIRDLIELSKAGLGDEVLLALIEVDRSVFTIDTATLKKLKEAGVSETVIVALIKSGRPAPTPEPVPSPEPEPVPASREPQVVVIDHRDPAPAPAPITYPVAVPVYVPVATDYGRRYADRTVSTVLSTDQGLVRARVPVPANCIKAQPVYWGFNGQLRPGSWEPPPTVVCR